MNVAERSLSQRQKCRVVCVGLLHKAFGNFVGEFPDLDLRYMRNDKGAPDQSALKGADRVVFNTKFISHAQLESIASLCDPGKVVRVYGGTSQFRAALTSIQSYARILAAQNVIALPVRDEKPDPFRIDFSALRLASSGQVLTYMRPEGMQAHTFEAEVSNALSFYAKDANVKASHHISGGKATITVERGADHLEKEKAASQLEKAEAALLEPNERPEQARNAKRFWRDVYLESFRARPNAPWSEHVAFADAAMSAWLSLFPKKETK